MMHWILAKITSFLQKLFSEKNVFSLNFISALIDSPGQNYAGTVIPTIERNHFTASLVNKNHFWLYDENFLHRKYR